MSRFRFSMAYEGEAVDAGTISVYDLAPALLAVGDLCREANRVVNGEDATVDVAVKADFRSGSFEVGLEVLQRWGTSLFTALLSPEARNAKFLADLLFMGAKIKTTLIDALRWIAGRRIAHQTIALPTGERLVRLRLVDSNETLDVTEEVFRLLESDKTREAAEQLARPLAREGINRLSFRVEGSAVESIGKEDGAALRAPGPEPDPEFSELPAQEFDAALKILQISLVPGYQSRFALDENNRFTASIEDEQFLEKIQRGEPFAHGDWLQARVRFVQERREDGKIHSRHAIVNVSRHIRRTAPQPPLPGGA